MAPFGKPVRPLVDQDREHGSDLDRTPQVCFGAGANAREAADRLRLHRSSHLYRLERIGNPIGLDLKDHRVALALQPGLMVLERGEVTHETEHP